MAPSKMLVCGDVMGEFKALFATVNKIHLTKGPFESLFCVGNFFGNKAEEYEDLKSGRITVPIMTYILNGNQLQFREYYEPLSNAVPNIVYLGKMGCLTCTSGIKVAYLSGVELSCDTPESIVQTSLYYNRYFSRSSVKTMINLVGSGTDILLTSQWPRDVTKHDLPLDKIKESKLNECSSHLISQLAKAAKPRYHFSGMAGFYYERAPYRNHVDHLEPPINVTYFVGLGPVNTREKWLFCLTLVPASSLTSTRLAVCTRVATVCPYNWEFIGSSLDHTVDANFFFGPPTSGPSTSGINASRKRSAEDCSKYELRCKPKKNFRDTSTCWFCLANKHIENHLIITIGAYCYITLVKGILVPEHVCIVPINHVATSPELSYEAFVEMEEFKEALTAYFYDKNKDTVIFERSYCSPHLQVQVVPIPRNIEKQIKDKINHFGKSFRITKLPSHAMLGLVIGKSTDYIFFEIFVDKIPNNKYLFSIDKSEKDFPPQIARIILAEVLDLVDRINWQMCEDSYAEKMMAKRMRETFQNYDFINNID